MHAEPQIAASATVLAGLVIELHLILADHRVTSCERARLAEMERVLRSETCRLEGLELAIQVARQALGQVGAGAPNPRLAARIRDWQDKAVSAYARAA